MPKDYTLVQTSDWHLGPSNCHREAIFRMIERVALDPDCYIVGVGDLVDAVVPSDKRYAHCAMELDNPLLTPHEQAREVTGILEPVRDKVVAVGLGNHEYTTLNTFNICAYICDTLSLPYGAYNFKFIAIGKTNPVHKMYFTHGAGQLPSGAKDPIQRMANRKAALKRKLDESKHADCIYLGCGHNHQLLTVEPTVEDELMLTDVNGSLEQKYRYHEDQTADYIPPESRWYGSSGSFLKLYSEPGSGAVSYGEVKGYPPAEIGWLEIVVRDYQVVGVNKVIAE